MIVKNKQGTLYELNGIQWDESDGSWLASLAGVMNEGFAGYEVRLPLASFANHFTPENIVTGVECNRCGNTLPAHTDTQHDDENDPIHQCPHKEETDGNNGA